MWLCCGRPADDSWPCCNSWAVFCMWLDSCISPLSCLHLVTTLHLLTGTGTQKELCYCVLVRNLVKLCLKYMRWRCKQCIPHMLVPINHITSRDNTAKTIWIFTTIRTTCFVISLIQCLNPCITSDAAFYSVGVLCDLCATGMLASNQRFSHPSRLSVC